jgi:hypothetical protein
VRSNPLRFLVTGLAFGLAFVVNPAYLSGCASGEDEPDLAKIEADLLEELDGLNGQGALSFSYEGHDYELLLALTQQGGQDELARAPGARFMSTAHACGNHTFFQSASACATFYQLALEGTVTLRRLGEDAAVLAELPVTGTLGLGLGSFEIADGGALLLLADEEGAQYVESFEAQDLGEAMVDFSYRHDYSAP